MRMPTTRPTGIQAQQDREDVNETTAPQVQAPLPPLRSRAEEYRSITRSRKRRRTVLTVVAILAVTLGGNATYRCVQHSQALSEWQVAEVGLTAEVTTAQALVDSGAPTASAVQAELNDLNTAYPDPDEASTFSLRAATLRAVGFTRSIGEASR